jgi:excisionase family DNA binding protein
MADGGPVMTIEEVAKYLHVHPQTVYRMLKKGAMPGFKIGSDWRFNRETISAWIAKAEANSPHRSPKV